MASPLRVLLIDDDEDELKLTQSLLDAIDPAGFHLEWAPSVDEARRRLATGHFDVCLVDYRLGAADGAEFVRTCLHEGHEGPYIMLTGLDRREVDIEAMSAGASDYLVKGQITPALLERSIRYSIEAKRTQAAIRESERRLREVADTVREVFWVYDVASAKLSYISSRYAEIVGRDPADVFADPAVLIEYIHPSDRAHVLDALKQMPAAQLEEDFRITRPDGAMRWICARVFPLRDDGGRLIRLIGTAEDITSRRRVEDAQRLLAAAGRLTTASLDVEETLQRIARLLVPSMADACLIEVLDRVEGGRLSLRAHAFVDREEQNTVLELRRRFPTSGLPQDPIWKVLTTGDSLLYRHSGPEFTWQFANAPELSALARRVRWTSYIGAPLKTASRVLGVISMMTCAGRQPFDEQDLQLVEEIGRRAATTIEHARLYREADLAKQRERAQAGRLRTLSDASKRFMEGGFDMPRLMASIAQFVAHHFGELGVVRLLAADGQRLDLGAIRHRTPALQPIGEELLARPLVLDEAAPARLFDVGLPIVVKDARKEMPAFLDALYRPYLERRPIENLLLVPMRTHGRRIGTIEIGREQPAQPFSDDDVALVLDLAERGALGLENARLYNEAQRAIRLRDDVFAVVSHDIANPLNVIYGAARQLVTTPDAPRLVAMIQRAADTAMRLTRDLMDSVAIESGRLSITPMAVDVPGLVAEAVDAFEAQARDASIALQRLATEPMLVSADRGRVLQVLSNLIGNALKFSPPNGTIVVQAVLESNEVCFSVRDTGPGIPQDDVFHVFERYWRGSHGSRGLGLGLAISKVIIEAHGGRIWAQSAEGVGSTFCFTLPVATTPHAAPSITEDRDIQSAPGSPSSVFSSTGQAEPASARRE